MSKQVRLFGAIAVRPAILPLIPQFEAATGCTVTSRWELNPAVKEHIEAGEAFDLVVTNPNLVQNLMASKKVRAGSQLAFGRISMGMAARAGSRPFDVGSVEAFERALRMASSIAYASDGTSGSYFTSLLESLGMADEVRHKLVAITGGGPPRQWDGGKPSWE